MKTKLDVLLVNAPSPSAGAIISHRIHGLPPLGICYIATWLNNKGYPTRIFDFAITKNTISVFKEMVKNEQPSIIGISTSTETYKTGIRIAKAVKQFFPDCFIVLGGYHVSFEYESALSHNEIDCIVRGEGEITFEELCEVVLNQNGSIADIKGIAYRDNDKIVTTAERPFIPDLDILPIPDRSLFQLNEYSVPASISTSRGCPSRCIYCAATALSGGRYRMRSPERIIEEIKALVEMGFHRIQFVDDSLTISLPRLDKILDLILSNGLEITWDCESRVNGMTRNILEKMYSAGCRHIQFGVEAGSQKMLDSLKKGIKYEDIFNTIKNCRDIGIIPSSGLILGQPYDTKETMEETIQMGLKLQALGTRVMFSISTPFPGTEMYIRAKEMGLIIEEYDTDLYTTSYPVYSTKNFKTNDVRNAYYNAYKIIGENMQKNMARKNAAYAKQTRDAVASFQE